MSVLIVSPPRSGSSLVAQLLESGGFTTDKVDKNKVKINPSNFNKNGYKEDVCFTLLNDQLTKCLYGENYSFIYAPNNLKIKFFFENINFTDLQKIIPENYKYDIDEQTIFLPLDYEKKIKKYTGLDWDVWGLTRMQEEGKWYKVYSKFKVSNKKEILIKLKEFSEKLKNKNKYYLKDPRLIFSLPIFWKQIKNEKYAKIIFIERNQKDTIDSMRSHYGQRLFTDKFIDNKMKIVSNHFNYKIGSQNVNEYFKSIQTTKAFIKTLGKRFLIINYDNIISERKSAFEISNLENFLNIKIDYNLIKKNKK